MYVAIDVGGTKTLVAVFDEAGTLGQSVKFLTPVDYQAFIDMLKQAFRSLKVAPTTVAMAIPGKVDRANGVGLAFGNLEWRDVPIQKDVEAITNCPVLIENDANLAGLYEAITLKDEFKKVLYITISTGIGSGFITNGVIDPELADSEAGFMLISWDDKRQPWEDFASGKAIVATFGKPASQIDDEATWKEIVPRFSVGLQELSAIYQPDVIVIGGGVGSHFDRFEGLLAAEMQKDAMPLVQPPALRPAQHAEEAVIYGCYELIKQHNATTA